MYTDTDFFVEPSDPTTINPLSLTSKHVMVLFFGSSVIMDNLAVLIVGNVVAFVVAVLAVKFFIDYVTKYGFKLFGYYRIIVGVVILVMLMSGANLTID